MATAPTLEEQAKLFEKVNKDYMFPDNATLRYEYVKCGRANCKCKTESAKIHGPYYYVYWKENGKLRKGYVGKNLEDYQNNMKIRTGLAYTHGHPRPTGD
jgi:hypothetical protein